MAGLIKKLTFFSVSFSHRTNASKFLRNQNYRFKILIKLNFINIFIVELNYYDQKVRRTLARDIQKH